MRARLAGRGAALAVAFAAIEGVKLAAFPRERVASARFCR
jgi:hypothetical protein